MRASAILQRVQYLGVNNLCQFRHCQQNTGLCYHSDYSSLQCSTLVRNTVIRATFKVNGKPPILGSCSPLTPWPIDLRFHKVDYFGDIKPQAKNGKNRPRGAGPAKGWNVKVNLGYFLFFCRITCPSLEITLLHGSTPLLNQMTCFGVDWFPRGVNVRVKIFPLLYPQNLKYLAHFWT